MALFRALTIFAALVALASLPCLIAMLVVGMDDLSHRTGGVVDRLRSLKIPGQAPGEWWPLAPDEEDSIEQIAADLRDLSQALRGDPRLLGPTGPERAVRHAAILAAYETRLQDACRALNVAEHLDDLTGVDREIERVRIEGVLQAQGLVLRSARSRGRE
ncbi:MAG: hypothetical protein GEU94_14225 [Micromonosporaceae bacterium]|nr:hypothetical protein [Micromonosporaceae bacterium]